MAYCYNMHHCTYNTVATQRQIKKIVFPHSHNFIHPCTQTHTHMYTNHCSIWRRRTSPLHIYSSINGHTVNIDIVWWKMCLYTFYTQSVCSHASKHIYIFMEKRKTCKVKAHCTYICKGRKTIQSTYMCLRYIPCICKNKSNHFFTEFSYHFIPTFGHKKKMKFNVGGPVFLYFLCRYYVFSNQLFWK